MLLLSFFPDEALIAIPPAANNRKSAIKKTQKTTTSGVNKAAVSSELDYRVQVGASRQIAEPGYYTKLNKAIPEFDVLQNDGDDGWYRYTIGSFKDVNSAQNLLSKVKQLGYDCFLVAFKDGKRMTINDAKKITTQ